MKLVKYIAWPSALLLAGCLHWPDAPETVQAPIKPEQVEEFRMQADGPLRARASTAYPQLTAPSAEQAKLNKAIENRFRRPLQAGLHRNFPPGGECRKRGLERPDSPRCEFLRLGH